MSIKCQYVSSLETICQIFTHVYMVNFKRHDHNLLVCGKTAIFTLVCYVISNGLKL